MTTAAHGWPWFVICWFATFLISALAVRWAISRAVKWGLIDVPNDRSLHSGIVPRSGGLGILVGVGAGWLFAGAIGYVLKGWPALVVAAGAVAVISLLDDLRDLSPWPRIAVHLAASLAPVALDMQLRRLEMPGLAIELDFAWGALLSVLFATWFINLYNFMDGMDGLSGGMTFFGFGTLTVLGVMHGELAFALGAGVVSAAAVGFLLFNFPPARVFMGDVGSAPLGFLAAVFLLRADALGIAPLWLGVLVFGPFFVDATATVIRRAVQRETLWEAHCGHFYQRCVQAGWTQRRTLLTEYALMSACGGTAILVANAGVWCQWAAIVTWAVVYLVCGTVVLRTSAAVRQTS